MSEHILLDSILYRIEYHIISWVKPLYRQTRNGQWTGRAKLLLYINARTCWSSNRMFNEIKAKRERACSDTPVFPVKKLSVAAEGQMQRSQRMYWLETEHWTRFSCVGPRLRSHVGENLPHVCVTRDFASVEYSLFFAYASVEYSWILTHQVSVCGQVHGVLPAVYDTYVQLLSYLLIWGTYRTQPNVLCALKHLWEYLNILETSFHRAL
jgi:hypothetical protein